MIAKKGKLKCHLNLLQEQLKAAAELFHQLLEGKSKAFSGSTFAAFKGKVKSVHACGYFDNVPIPSESATQESQEKVSRLIYSFAPTVGPDI